MIAGLGFLVLLLINPRVRLQVARHKYTLTREDWRSIDRIKILRRHG